MSSNATSILVQTCASSGPGLRLAVKDCIDLAGLRTTCGSRALADVPPAPANAAVVERLLADGFRVIGKAAMHELAYGMTGINPWTGTPDNARYPGVIPGGSSSGSAAAVAAGLADVALGSDTGGSIRLPAACCGVVGLKPTFGRLSRDGVAPAHTTLDCVGPLAGTVALIERAMAAMDPDFAPLHAPGRPIVGHVITASDPAPAQAVTAALARSGLPVVALELDGFAEAFEAGVIIMAAEAHAAYAPYLETGRLGADVAARLRAAPQVATAARLAWAREIKTRFDAALDRAFAEVAVLAMPTLPAHPPRLDEPLDAAAMLRLSAHVRPFNLSGHPALSLPLASAPGQPCALQLVAPRGADALLCAVARRFFETN